MSSKERLEKKAVRNSSEEKLRRNITKLEAEVYDLEARLGGFSNSDEKFIVSIESEYGKFMDAIARDLERDSRLDRSITRDDIKQEAMVYLLKYTSGYAKRVKGKPYVARSMMNAFINLVSKATTSRRSGYKADPEASETLVETIANRSLSYFTRASIENPERELLYADLVREIRSSLGGDLRELFDAMLDPDPALLRISRRFSHGRVKLTVNVLSMYFGWSKARTGKLVKKLRFELERLCFEKSYA